MSDKNSSILLIDDDAEIRYSLDRVLSQEGHHVVASDSGEQGIQTAKEIKPSLIFLDNRMGGISGIETLQHLRTAAPDSLVILMTAYGTTQTAIEAMKHGAFDYVLKPFDLVKLKELVAKALKACRDSTGTDESYQHLLNSADYAEGIVGSGEKMQEVLKKVGQVAASEATVMITGESGTGKELVAHQLHEQSDRNKQEFVEVNCAAIPSELIESELFGHVKGAFTSAIKDRSGKFESAHKGTLFLDEIADMSLAAQAKVLRALQEKKVQRVGSDKSINVDVRVIAATNKNLKKEIEEGRFREDLYHRLAVILIEVPALSDRKDDIPLLANHFINLLCKEEGIEMKSFSDAALDKLCDYPWTGNVRELRNVVERLMILGDNPISTENIQQFAPK